MQVWGAQTAAHKWGDPAGAELLAQVVVGCAQRWNLPSLEFIRYFYLNRHSRGLLANSTTGSFSLELPCCLESHVANLNTVLFCRERGVGAFGEVEGKTHIRAQSLTWLPRAVGVIS